MNVSFCGDKAGATLFPAHIYNDEAGVLETLIHREEQWTISAICAVWMPSCVMCWESTL